MELELYMDIAVGMLEAALWGLGAICAPLWLIHKFLEGRPPRKETKIQKEVASHE